MPFATSLKHHPVLQNCWGSPNKTVVSQAFMFLTLLHPKFVVVQDTSTQHDAYHQPADIYTQNQLGLCVSKHNTREGGVFELIIVECLRFLNQQQKFQSESDTCRLPSYLQNMKYKPFIIFLYIFGYTLKT